MSLTFSKKQTLLISVIATALIYFLAIFSASCGNGADDDWAIAVTLSGRLDGSWICLFLNAAFSQVCLFLNTAIPNLNWFFVIERTFAFWALCLSLYLCLFFGRKNPLNYIFVAGVFLLALPEISYFGNFTAFGGLCVAVSCYGFFILATQERFLENPFVVISCVILFVAGFCLRSRVALLSLPFILFAFLFIRKRTEISFKSIVKKAAPIGVAILLCAGLYAYDSFIWNSNEGWNDWKAYNNARAEISDYPMASYEEVADQLTAHGITEEEYELAQLWITEDSNVFNTDSLTFISTFREESTLSQNLAHIPAALIPYIKSIILNAKLFIVLLLTALVALLSKGNRLSTFFFLLLGFAICIYFESSGRLPTRVEYPIWLLSIGAAASIAKPWIHKTIPIEKISLAGLAACLALVFALLIPSFSSSYAQASINQKNYNPDTTVMNYLNDNSDKIYVWDSSSYYNIEKSYRLIFLPTTQVLEQNLCLGGWESNSPFSNERNAKAGLSNILRDISTNEKAFFITDNPELTTRILSYIQSHYYPNATVTQTDSFINEDGETLTVWKFNSKQ